MQKPTLFIHIGVHKTGTTSIQHFFSKYYHELIDFGIIFRKRRNKINERHLVDDSYRKTSLKK